MTQNPNNMIQIYCTRCGKKLAPDGKCTYCKVLKATKAQRRPVADAVYTYCDSPLTLVLAFFWTLTTILTVIFGLRTPLLSVPVDIPCVLLVIGLWMLHTCASSGKRKSMGLISFSIILAMILTLVLLMLAVLFSFFGLFVTVSISGMESMMLPFTLFAVCLLVLLPLSVLYLVQLNGLFLTARSKLWGSPKAADTPLFAILFTILLGVGYLFLALRAGAADTLIVRSMDILKDVLPSGLDLVCTQLEALSFQWIRPQLLAAGVSSLYTVAAMIVYRVRIRKAEEESAD